MIRPVLNTNRVFLHVDMDNYYCSVAAKYDGSLKNIPFAVCGDPAMRHSIVLSKNALAKEAGVITGESSKTAKQKCPPLVVVNPDYNKYLEYAKLAREIYRKYTDKVIPYGLDEAWLDLTETGITLTDATQIAELIRLEVMYSLGLSASIGVSFNYVFSKIGSDYNKPNSITVITPDEYKRIVWKLPASDLLFVGAKTRSRLYRMGILSIGDIANADPVRLGAALGKKGHTAWLFANGDDSEFRPDVDDIKSVSHTITPPRDLLNNEDASAVIYMLAAAVSARLEKHGFKSGCIGITLKDNRFNTITRQQTLAYPASDIGTVFGTAYSLFKRHYKWQNNLRAVGIRADSLTERGNEQVSFWDSLDKKESSTIININIDERVRSLVQRYGELEVEKTAMMRG